MYSSPQPQDALVFYDTTTFSSTGAVTWPKTGLTYVDMQGIGTIALQVVGAFTAGVSFQVSNDLTNWTAACMQNDASVPLAENTTITNTPGMFTMPTHGWRYFRLNVTSYTSSPTLYLYGRAGTSAPATQPVSAIQDGTWTVQPGNTANTTAWLMKKAYGTRSDTFTSTTSGTAIDCSSNPHMNFGIQVKATGAVTSWTVLLEGSLDNTNFFTIATHTNADPADGGIKWASNEPVLYYRSRCSAITLGAGTNVIATILGTAI